jgi:chitodextrinase
MSSSRRLPVLVLVLLFSLVALTLSRAGARDDEGRPTQPTNLVADSAGSGAISLSWSASTDDHGVRGYMVFRDGSNVGTAANTEYLDRGLAPGRYTYRVAATDRDGNVSERSAPASATATR